MFPGRALDASEVTDWLNKLEQVAPLVVYLGGREASAWTRKAIRQADMVVFACRGDAPARSADGDRSLRLRGSSRLGAAPRAHS